MEIATQRKIQGGVYLVIDPSMEETALLQKLGIALQQPVAAVQIWDNFLPGKNLQQLIEKVVAQCHFKNVPALINNAWQWMLTTELDGVHFDITPTDIEQIRTSVGREFICGITCSNDLAFVRRATSAQMDYISFCSIFPSPTSNSCELVDFKTINAARQITKMPIFLAGGILPENMQKLAGVDFEGVAVISGIMGASKPDEAIKTYLQQLKTVNNETRDHQ